MRHLLCLFALAASAPAFAQTSPFDGTWKGDLASAKLPAKPDVMLLKGGTYSCSSCTPAVTTRADGQFHAIPGHDYWDELKVTVDGPRAVSYVYRMKGKEISRSTDTVSADGKTLTSSWTSSNNAKGTPISGSATETRVAATPAGAHPISGSWRQDKVQEVSAPALMMTFKENGNALTFTAGTGETYTATYGGPAVALQGDPAGTMIAVTKPDASTILETDTRGGKPVSRYRYKAMPDGRSLAMEVNDLRQGTTTTVTAFRQ